MQLSTSWTIGVSKSMTDTGRKWVGSPESSSTSMLEAMDLCHNVFLCQHLYPATSARSPCDNRSSSAPGTTLNRGVLPVTGGGLNQRRCITLFIRLQIVYARFPFLNLETRDFTRLWNESIRSFMSSANLSSSSKVGRSSAGYRRGVSKGTIITSRPIH